MYYFDKDCLHSDNPESTDRVDKLGLYAILRLFYIILRMCYVIPIGSRISAYQPESTVLCLRAYK